MSHTWMEIVFNVTSQTKVDNLAKELEEIPTVVCYSYGNMKILVLWPAENDEIGECIEKKIDDLHLQTMDERSKDKKSKNDISPTFTLLATGSTRNVLSTIRERVEKECLKWSSMNTELQNESTVEFQ